MQKRITGVDEEAMLRRVFDFILEPKGNDKNAGLFRLFVFAALIIGLVSIIFVTLQTAEIPKTDTAAKLGQAGDFFGGILNPLLTFLTFIGVLATIFLQREELTETREELRRQADALEIQHAVVGKQNFENTFFQMMSLHNEIVGTIKVRSSYDNRTATGRAAFKVLREDLGRQYEDRQNSTRNISLPGQHDSICKSYDAYWKDYRQELGHYYRVLFNLVRLADDAEIVAGGKVTEDRRWKYVRLIRAQLSDYELVMLFYNCISDQGHEFALFAERYGMLKHTPEDMLMDPSHKELLQPGCFINPVVD